ncbi:adhesion G protein-coupled receptor L3-like [Actinia tenebrosa]|uniref:Adhesion G protein-coupled receptor L3-like n=1 Tax=Actinia tenebrosa TaxID=6105 RepID=A0A6P8HU91_ACTTE|nr:adhesion G protein-coupled receptor L3-like [Actinia tenebrosa]
MHVSSTVVSLKSPVSTSLPTTSVSTNVHAVSSTPSLPSTTIISSNYADDHTTASPSVYSRKSLQEITTTSEIESSFSNLNSTEVTKYLQQIRDLDSTLATSAKFASELTTNLLKSFTTSNKHSSKPMIAIDTFENFLSEYGQQHLNYSNREIHWDTASMAVQIMRIYEPFDGIQLHSPNNDVSIYFQQENFINGTIVVQVIYNDLHHILPSLFTGNAEKLEIGSKITSILRGLPSNQTAFKTNVTISFMNLKGARPKGTPNGSRKCVFWLFSPRNSEQKDGKWSDEGCTLLHSSDDETVCSCNHLTSFAVLMQTPGKNKISSFDQDTLSLLTIVGLSLSLFGSTVTFIAYITLTDRKSNLSQIRLNLVASLGMAHFLFVTGIRATHFPAICVMVGALLQLFFLASLCWMLVEGIQLYFRIVRVYNSEMTIKACYLFAWGFPAFLVCVSLSISSFGPKGIYGFVQEDICWVSHYLYLAWVFNVPMSLILLANLIFFLRVMKEISKMKIRQPKPQRLSVVRRNLKACCLFFPLLGITWFTGCVIMFHPYVILIYIFTILNSTQGFFIFLFHCVGNREIRSAFKKKIYPNDVSRMEKRNEPIPLAIASVSNVFCDGIHPPDDPRDEDKALPAGHKPNYRA